MQSLLSNFLAQTNARLVDLIGEGRIVRHPKLAEGAIQVASASQFNVTLAEGCMDTCGAPKVCAELFYKRISEEVLAEDNFVQFCELVLPSGAPLVAGACRYESYGISMRGMVLNNLPVEERDYRLVRLDVLCRSFGIVGVAQ